MKRILLVGEIPERVDFSDPALPPGMDADMINAGIEVAVRAIADRGWTCDTCMVEPDDSARGEVERKLASKAYDCVVIGAGLRLLPSNFEIFEAVVNAVHRAAPGAAIAFNTRPEDSVDAAARWVGSK